MPAEQLTFISISTESVKCLISLTSNLNISTSRAGRSTTSPSRTRWCAALPSILIAETEDGFCLIFPTNFANSNLICSSVIADVSAVEITSPSLSSVCVALPNEIVASYAFFPSVIYGSNFVATPTPKTKTPVAIGSNVPAWPTRLVFNFFRAIATTSWLVIPPTLFTKRKPSI